MRAIIATAIIAGGIAVAGLSSVSAAPVNGAVINQAATTLESTMKAHWRGPSRYRCHVRWRSYWTRCW